MSMRSPSSGDQTRARFPIHTGSSTNDLRLMQSPGNQPLLPTNYRNLRKGKDEDSLVQKVPRSFLLFIIGGLFCWVLILHRKLYDNKDCLEAAPLAASLGNSNRADAAKENSRLITELSEAKALAMTLKEKHSHKAKVLEKLYITNSKMRKMLKEVCMIHFPDEPELAVIKEMEHRVQKKGLPLHPPVVEGPVAEPLAVGPS